MAENLTNIKERILYFIEDKGITKREFFIGIKSASYGTFKGTALKSALNSDAVAEILTKYPEINIGWLLTGKGEKWDAQMMFDIMLEISKTSLQVLGSDLFNQITESK